MYVQYERETGLGPSCLVDPSVNKLVLLNVASMLTVVLLHRAGVITMQQHADNKCGVQSGFIRKGLGYQAFEG